MQEHKKRQARHLLGPHYLHPRRGVCTRSPIRLQSIEEAMDRRKRRFCGRDHRTGPALPFGSADLWTARESL